MSSLQTVFFLSYRLNCLKIEVQEHTNTISVSLPPPPSIAPSYPVSHSLQGSCGLAASSLPTTSSTNWAASRSPWCDRAIGWVTLAHHCSSHFSLFTFFFLFVLTSLQPFDTLFSQVSFFLFLNLLKQIIIYLLVYLWWYAVFIIYLTKQCLYNKAPVVFPWEWRGYFTEILIPL